MPRVFLSQEERISERFASWVYGQMKVRRISQSYLAGEMHITQQALSYKLKNRQFSFSDFVTIIGVLEPEESELAWLVGRGAK